MKYVVKTFGCKANLHDSQVIESALNADGWTPASGLDEVSLCVVNSCAVTDEAEKQVRKLVNKLSREHPNAKVVVTGCAAEVNSNALKQATKAHYIVGNQNKDQLVHLVTEQMKVEQLKAEKLSNTQLNSHILSKPLTLGTLTPYQTLISQHPTEREWPAIATSFQGGSSLADAHTSKTRAFLKIQEGCDAFCTYCIIPYGRGPSRSLDIPALIKQINGLCSSGVREIVLTGTNIGDYGADKGGKPQVELLVKTILAKTPLLRLRLSSLDPTEITPEVLEIMRENRRLCPHFHVSLQSVHSRILRLMKRKYGFEQVKTCLESIHKLANELADLPGGVFVGMDVITGFPGETDEEFEWAYDRLCELPWNRLHVFPYSERAGTPATRLPNPVRQEIRVKRAKRLNELSMTRLKGFYQNLLTSSDDLILPNVLMEQVSPSGWATGHTANYLKVLLRNVDARNELLTVKVSELMVDSKSRDVGLVGCLSPSGGQLP